MINCTDVPPFSDIVTMIFNMVDTKTYTSDKITTLIKNIQKIYPKVRLIIAKSSRQKVSTRSLMDPNTVSFVDFKTRYTVQWFYSYISINFLAEGAQCLFQLFCLSRMNLFSLNSAKSMEIWKSLVSKVETKYVFVGRNVVHFSWHSRLERLVREISDLQAAVVAGSYRYMSGLVSRSASMTS